jgi:hypothetical protein
MKAVTPIVPGENLAVLVMSNGDPAFSDVPVYMDTNKVVTIRWRLTWRERLQVFLYGDLYHQVMTNHGGLQPVKLSTSVPRVYS